MNMKESFFTIVTAGLLFGAFSLTATAAVPSNADVLAAAAKVSEALASDNLPGAKGAAEALVAVAEAANHGALAERATAVASASDLAAARKQFKALGAEAGKLAQDVKGFTVMHCPMVDADWVQTSGPTRNPYYGKSMLGCGGPKKKGHSGMGGM